MALVALASNRSPGLTTSVLALAAAWPVPRLAVVAELDPSGGTIAARQVVSHDPGLLGLAAAASHHLSEALISRHLQQLAEGPAVLLAPPGPDRAVAALRAALAAGLAPMLRALPGLDVLADCGRVDARSPALPVLAEADLCVFVARPTTQDIIGLDHRLQTLAPDPDRSGLVVIGRRPYPPEDAARVTGLRLLGVIDEDVKGATRLGDGVGCPRTAPLLRSAGAVADVLVRDLPDAPPTSDGQPAPDDLTAPLGPTPSARPPASSQPA